MDREESLEGSYVAWEYYSIEQGSDRQGIILGRINGDRLEIIVDPRDFPIDRMARSLDAVARTLKGARVAVVATPLSERFPYDVWNALGIDKKAYVTLREFEGSDDIWIGPVYDSTEAFNRAGIDVRQLT